MDGPQATARRLRELLLLLGRLRSLRDPIAATCEEAQFTPPQIHALVWLGHEQRLTMGDLARRVGVNEKTVTGLVDRLERDGFVERERHPADRRVIYAVLTGKGQKTFEHLDEHMLDKLTRLMSVLEPQDRRSIVTVLENLLVRLASGGFKKVRAEA